jgi:hypothetical protein
MVREIRLVTVRGPARTRIPMFPLYPKATMSTP